MLNVFRGDRPDITPVQLTAIIAAIVQCLHAFGIYDVTPEQQDALNVASGLLLAVVLGDVGIRAARNSADAKVQAAALSVPAPAMPAPAPAAAAAPPEFFAPVAPAAVLAPEPETFTPADSFLTSTADFDPDHDDFMAMDEGLPSDDEEFGVQADQESRFVPEPPA